MYIHIKSDIYGPLHRLPSGDFHWSGQGKISPEYNYIESSRYHIYSNNIANFTKGIVGVSIEKVIIIDGDTRLMGNLISCPLVTPDLLDITELAVFSVCELLGKILMAGRLVSSLSGVISLDRIDSRPIMLAG